MKARNLAGGWGRACYETPHLSYDYNTKNNTREGEEKGNNDEWKRKNRKFMLVKRFSLLQSADS